MNSLGNILFMFFVNKPLTVIPYITTLAIFLYLSFFSENDFIFPFFTFLIGFTAWYPVYLIYHYILREDGDFEIRGINISVLRKPVKFVLMIDWIIFLIAATIIITAPESIFIAALLITVVVCILNMILESYATAKLVSEGIKKNVHLKDLDFQGLYTELRELLTKRLIQ
jgi:hypothetical protein